MPAMLITTGQQDAYVVPENRAFRDTLRRGGFSYQYREAPAFTIGHIGLTNFPYM